MDFEATCNRENNLVSLPAAPVPVESQSQSEAASAAALLAGASGAARGQLLRAAAGDRAGGGGVSGVCPPHGAPGADGLLHGAHRHNAGAVRARGLPRPQHGRCLLPDTRRTAAARRADRGVPLADALDGLHRWLLQHGYVGTGVSSCPVTWTGDGALPRRSGPARRARRRTHDSLSALARLGPQGRPGARAEVEGPRRAQLPEAVDQPEGRLWRSAQSVRPHPTAGALHGVPACAACKVVPHGAKVQCQPGCGTQRQPCASRPAVPAPCRVHGNLRTCVEAAGVTWEGRAHSGLDDARNTARLAAALLAGGACLSVTGCFPGCGPRGLRQCTLFPDR